MMIINFFLLEPTFKFRYYQADNEFGTVKDHSSYDDFWQKRVFNMKNNKPAVMTVGGWFDAKIYTVH
jgi:predicted acyl esterase